jgi:hypothetical protein
MHVDSTVEELQALDVDSVASLDQQQQYFARLSILLATTHGFLHSTPLTSTDTDGPVTHGTAELARLKVRAACQLQCAHLVSVISCLENKTFKDPLPSVAIDADVFCPSIHSVTLQLRDNNWNLFTWNVSRLVKLVRHYIKYGVLIPRTARTRKDRVDACLINDPFFRERSLEWVTEQLAAMEAKTLNSRRSSAQQKTFVPTESPNSRGLGIDASKYLHFCQNTLLQEYFSDDRTRNRVIDAGIQHNWSLEKVEKKTTEALADAKAVLDKRQDFACKRTCQRWLKKLGLGFFVGGKKGMFKDGANRPDVVKRLCSYSSFMKDQLRRVRYHFESFDQHGNLVWLEHEPQLEDGEKELIVHNHDECESLLFCLVPLARVTILVVL